jgi:hypothetical protein
MSTKSYLFRYSKLSNRIAKFTIKWPYKFDKRILLKSITSYSSINQLFDNQRGKVSIFETVLGIYS